MAARQVNAEELLRRAAAASGTQEVTARRFLDSLSSIVRDEIRHGNDVLLTDGLGFAAKGEAAQKVETARTKDRYRVLFVVPQKDFFSNVIAQRLTGPRSEVGQVEGAESGLMDLKREKPDLVVLDANVPGARDLCRGVKRQRDTSLVSIVMIYGEGTDPAAVDGFKVCEDESITEPFEISDLVELAESEIARAGEERAFFQHEIHFQFRTREDTIEEANDFIAELVAQSGISDEGAAAFTVAFREAVDNAARHGNKSQENRVIDTIYILDREKITVTIEDEGDGFDTELYLTRGVEGNPVAVARERNIAGRAGGLGIMLMLKCLDNLEYNYVGNMVKLTKFVK